MSVPTLEFLRRVRGFQRSGTEAVVFSQDAKAIPSIGRFAPRNPCLLDLSNAAGGLGCRRSAGWGQPGAASHVCRIDYRADLAPATGSVSCSARSSFRKDFSP